MSDLTPVVKTQQGMLEFANPNHDPKNGQFTEGVAGKTVRAVKEQGGGTLEPGTGEAVKTGYMVGLGKHVRSTTGETVDAVIPVDSFDRDSVKNWLRRKSVRKLFAGNKVRAKIGVWVEDGKVYMEPSEQFVNGPQAIKAGTSRGEQGIYHLDKDQYIPTGGTA